MDESHVAVSDPCRLPTADEAAHFKEHGWVKLPKFVDPALVAILLAQGQRQMGPNADDNAPNPTDLTFFNPELANGLDNPAVRPLVEKAGESARILMGRRGEAGVRYFVDLFTPKLPLNPDATRPGAGRTHFHQDQTSWAVDRSGGMSFWIALTELTPDYGTMSFVSGSHRLGTLGDYTTYGGRDMLDIFPDLRDCPISDPVTYAAGDATVHSGMTVHGAGANLTAGPRWAYTIVVNPADARWTGAPAGAYDTTGMEQYQTFDDARFPIIA